MIRTCTRLPRSLVWTLALTALTTAVPTARAADSWPAFRGPDGAGRALAALPGGDGPLGLELVWKRPLGSGYSGIAVASGRLVTAMQDGERDVVVALDPASGEELWRYDLAPTYGGHDGSHDGPISTPALADGRVFALSPWGHLVALDLDSGAELWRAHLVDDLGAEAPYYGFGGSPAVADDVVLLQVGGAEGSVAAFEVGTGELRWRELPDEGPRGSQSPIIADIAGRRQVLVLTSNRVAGLAPFDGEVLWELELEGGMNPMGSLTQSPLPVGGGRVFVKHLDGEASLLEIRAGATGFDVEVVAAGRGLARSYSPPAVGAGRLYGYTARFLSALDPDSGELLWRSREPGDGFLLSVGDELAVVTKTGSLHLGAESTEGWRETARLQLFDDLAWTPPSYAGRSIYTRSLGEIARVDLVRAESPAVVAAAAPPPTLSPLIERLASGADAASAVESFLAGRELPLVDGREVVFLWHGEADDVAIAGDMIGMRREEPMRRLEGTDLWWWSTELDRRARMSYVFFVDYEARTDPSHGRTVESTVLGPDMNWFRGESIEMSWFAMPEWPGLEVAAAPSPAGPGGRLEQLEIALRPKAAEGAEAPEPVPVTVHVWLPPGYDAGGARYPVVYVHNGAAREAGEWPRTLDRVVGRSVEPLVAVFPEPPRMRGYGDLFVEQIVPEIDARYRTRPERRARANVGMGWPGFSAAEMTFEHPEVFGLLGLQSLFLLEDPMSELMDAIGDADASTLPLEIYLEWGRWDLVSPHEEMNMRDFSRTMWNVFREKGWQPVGGEVWDSTDFASWRNRTGVLLEALFPLEGAGTELAAWQTGR